MYKRIILILLLLCIFTITISYSAVPQYGAPTIEMNPKISEVLTPSNPVIPNTEIPVPSSLGVGKPNPVASIVSGPGIVQKSNTTVNANQSSEVSSTAISLNEANAKGTTGDLYWDIVTPGYYLLDFSPSSINTNHNYAISIKCSDVTIDGNGKTITGLTPGTVETDPSYYGIYVNTNLPLTNIIIKNINISNKNRGIALSGCQSSSIENSYLSYNKYGVTVYQSSHTTLKNNIVNNNFNGIQINGGGLYNSIISNTINNNVNGIYLNDGQNNIINGNILNNNSNNGIWFDNISNNNQFTSNCVNNTGWVGIFIEKSSNRNTFYNNFFYNDNNEVSDATISNNIWSISPIAGTNIIGGSKIGGNFWTNPLGTGFSDNTFDNNGDGFCDSAYSPSSDNTDYYPLHRINEIKHLDNSNKKGTPGYEYWDINSAGYYILDNSISTDNNYAIRILGSNVIFDGNGKTITGTNPPDTSDETGPSYYGVRGNSGTLYHNVTVKNISVSNKNMGIIFEYVTGGVIESSLLTSNIHGIYAWNCTDLKILSNTVNSGTHGIVLDGGHDSNNYVTIDSNKVNSNSQFGILLWYSNNHNIITNNQVFYNKNMGISLTDGDGSGAGGVDNTVSNNQVVGSQNGLYIANYHGNRIIKNTLSDNTNVAIWLLDSSSGNHFVENSIKNSGWVGVSLTNSANGNVFYNNEFKNIDNENSDGSSFNDQWYISPISGTNIIGGPSIGGNYWSNPSSTGFSDTQTDSNNDGFCDQLYNPQKDIVDKYPLKKTGVPAGSTIAAFSNGYWYVDSSGNHMWDNSDTIWGQFGAGSTPFVINNHIAAFSNGYWYIDSNDNHMWDNSDTIWGQFGAGSTPFVINNHIAAFSNGYWYIDSNDNHKWDNSDTIWGQFGAGSTPLVINNHIAAFSNGYWYVDSNDNHMWDNSDTIWGQFGAGSTPLVINNHIAAFSNGYWYIDSNDNHMWDSSDTIWGQFGAGSTPFVI